MIALWILLYVAIACIIGCFLYVQWESEEDCEFVVIFISSFWPIAIPIAILYFILKYVCTKLVNLFRYLKIEGLHYCKEDIKPCCGQCKYMYYWNNHNELNGCYLREAHSNISTETIPCSQFKKYWLWRFKIRYKWDKK